MTSVSLPAPLPANGQRSSSVLRAVLFLALTGPLWLRPGMIPLGPTVLAVALIVISWLFLRSERRSLAALGLELSWPRLRELLAGLLGGALLIVVTALVAGIALPFPWARNPAFSASAACFSLLYLLAANAVEELIFRGYSFDRLIAGIGHWPAQLVTALLFAVYHMAQGWPWQVALIGTTTGSLLFGLVFVRWRSLPAALGVHAAAKWTRDLLFADPPTAKTVYAPLAPRMWTPQEQLMAMVVFTAITLLACVALAVSIRSSRAARSHSAVPAPLTPRDSARSISG